MIKIIISVILNLIIWGVNGKEKPIFSFNIYENENIIGHYKANLTIPSLNIKAEANASLYKYDYFHNNYNIKVKVEEPIILDASGDFNISVDTSSMAKLFDVSLRSDTHSHLNAQSRTSVSKQSKSDNLIISTNLTFNDSFNNISANYNLTFIKAKTCPTLTLYHNLTTTPPSILQFSSNVTEFCDLDNNFSSQMNVSIDLGSQLWQLANGQLRQIFNFGRNQGSESMNATHPLMDISVVANWMKSSDLMHYKKAIFRSKVTEFIPSFEIEFKRYKDIPNQLILNILKEVPTIHNLFDSLEKDEL